MKTKTLIKKLALLLLLPLLIFNLITNSLPFGEGQGGAFAQDQHLSQFYATPLVLNPAMTGQFAGNFRAHLHHRQQWRQVLGKNSYITENVSFDMNNQKLGYGGYIMNRHAGTGGFNQLNALVSGSYEITNDPLKRHHLLTGVQLGMQQDYVNYSKLTWDDQYDYGYSSDGSSSTGGFNTSLASGEQFRRSAIYMFDLNFGLFYYYKHKKKKTQPYVGVSTYHVQQPKERFFEAGEYKNRLPRRYLINGGAKIKFNEKYSMEPNFMFQIQGRKFERSEKGWIGGFANEFNIGVLGYYYSEQYEAHFFLGPYYRSYMDAISVHTGIQYNEYRIGFSYDFNLSKLKEVSNGRGGYEISITYVKQKGRYVPSF